MSHTDDKLIRMANQIASFFKTQPGDKAIAKTANHLREFWDPSMLARMAVLLQNDVPGLDTIARSAAEQVTGTTRTEHA